MEWMSVKEAGRLVVVRQVLTGQLKQEQAVQQLELSTRITIPPGTCTLYGCARSPMEELRAQAQHQLAAHPSGLPVITDQKIVNRFLQSRRRMAGEHRPSSRLYQPCLACSTSQSWKALTSYRLKVLGEATA